MSNISNGTWFSYKRENPLYLDQDFTLFFKCDNINCKTLTAKWVLYEKI